MVSESLKSSLLHGKAKAKLKSSLVSPLDPKRTIDSTETTLKDERIIFPLYDEVI